MPLERAAAGFEGLEARWDLALTELVLAQAFLTAGRAGEAERRLARATVEFERLRVPRELEQARALASTLRASHGEPDGVRART